MADATTTHVDPARAPTPPPRRELLDDELLGEIELLGEVITRVAGRPGHLSPGQVDAVLGLPGSAETALSGIESLEACTLRAPDLPRARPPQQSTRTRSMGLVAPAPAMSAEPLPVGDVIPAPPSRTTAPML